MSRRLTSLAFVAVGFAVALTPRTALALDSGVSSDSNYDPGPASRRSDFAMGAFLGGTVGNATGYPNELDKIGVGKYQANTGVGAGTGGSFWIGGALRDWFVVGLGISGATVIGKGVQSDGSAFILHLETYPLFYKGGAWKDLGIFTEFGAGGRTIKTGDSKGPTVASGGAMSIVTFGAIYEPIRFGKFSAGPIAEFTYQFSDSMTTTAGVLGFRVAFYGGPG